MLYQGARQAVALARMHLQQGNVSARGEAIGKAIRIVDSGLKASLNLDAGGEIAARLDALYAYITRRLLEANAQASDAMLVEVDGLLATLEDGRGSPGSRADGRTTGSGSITMNRKAEYFERYGRSPPCRARCWALPAAPTGARCRSCRPNSCSWSTG